MTVLADFLGWAQLVTVFVLCKPFQSTVMQHPSLLDPFYSYKQFSIIFGAA
jgi:hypothetical protein